MSFKKKFLKNVSRFALFSYVSQALEFISTIVLSRVLVPEEYGFVAIITVFSGFILLFANVGVGTSVVRSDYGHTFHRYMFNLSIWMGVFFTIILMLMSYPVSVFFDDPKLILPIVVISVKFVFDSFTYIPYAILAKQLKFNHIGTAKLSGSVVQIGLSILMAYTGFSYWSLIVPMLISPVFQFLYLRKKVDVPLAFFGWKKTIYGFRMIKKLMGSLSLINLISYWSENVDKVVIGKMYSQADLGLYNRAFRFIMLSSRLVTGIFSTVLFPSLKDLMDQKGDVHKEYLDLLRIITLLNVPFLVILAIFPKQLVFILWGNDWMGVADYLPYVAIILVYQSIVNTMYSVFILYEKEKMLLLINILNTALTIAFVVVGGFYSMRHILIFLTLGMLLISIPLNIYFGFYKAFSYQKGPLLKFWLPLIGFGLAMFYTVCFDHYVPLIITISLFVVYLLFSIKNSIKKIFGYFMNKAS